MMIAQNRRLLFVVGFVFLLLVVSLLTLSLFPHSMISLALQQSPVSPHMVYGNG